MPEVDDPRGGRRGSHLSGRLVATTRRSRARSPFAATLVVLVGLVLLSACSAADTSSAPGSASAASSSPAPPAAIGFDETYRTDDGIVVQVTGTDEAKLGLFPNTQDPDAKEGDPFVLLATKITNRTEAKVELIPDAVVRYGPERTTASQVLVDEIEGAILLEPDKAYDYVFGFIIPDDSYDQVVMELTFTIDPLRTVVFSGSISPK